ncbi:conserved hypothetical protein [Talaromyces stipitatus ATCC 10500]|uniref:HAT C-terminal dimerisation domain-containing protein n=1 Tax=Talaromyces stipitatus (strain ATCC 10500 / CBS 375.48 / QM 6759 / NRRL 1006) TaxID=441959 RepID=B8MSE9_TALSN|nr:uncharacterized protein TSTA_000220 [Talaromyces stipitatus ATCC 10500]EED11944.1 conserved hypothetical protein [Talaromyces stipitatus ATCC 10500]
MEEERANDIQRKATFHSIGPLGKLHNIMAHIRGSAGRTKEFKDLAGRLIPLDNRTRWNSWYYMLSVALQFDAALDSYTKRHLDTLEAEYLSPTDWEKLCTTSKFLSLFNRATLKTQGDQATIDNVLFVMDIIIKHFENALQVEYVSDKEFCARIQNGWDAFNKYYSKSDDSPLYAAALILHPARRISWQKPALQKVKKLWEEYRNNAPYPMIMRSYENDQPRDLDDFDRIAEDLDGFSRPASQDEFEDYNTESPRKICTSALTWWCQDEQQKRWPRLSYIAIDILSIPAMSDEPERVFSGARHTISWERAQLSAENIERIECLKHWAKTGIAEEKLKG